MILAEGVQKRVAFLKRVREAMNLEGLDILGRNINEECEYPVQGVITRAVEDCSNTLGNVIRSVQVGGRVYLMKGPKVAPEIQPALDKWGEYYKHVDTLFYQLPNTPHERSLVIFEKTNILPRSEKD